MLSQLLGRRADASFPHCHETQQIYLFLGSAIIYENSNNSLKTGLLPYLP
jgi:hypothetical protein